MKIPSKSEVEAALFRYKCWQRGRILEAAFALLLGASRSEASQHTGVSFATLSKVGNMLIAEFGLKIKDARALGLGIPVPLSPDEREVVRAAAKKQSNPTQIWMRELIVSHAYEVLGQERPPEATVDWDEVARLANEGAPKPEPETPEPKAPVVKARKPPKAEAAVEAPPPPPPPPPPVREPPKPAPARPQVPATISVPRELDVPVPRQKRDERRELLRQRFHLSRTATTSDP